MHFENFPKVRVKQYSQGWVVEIQKKTWYGKKYWTHIVSVAGIEKRPWYYSSMSIAVDEAKKMFGWDLFHGYALYNT